MGGGLTVKHYVTHLPSPPTQKKKKKKKKKKNHVNYVPRSGASTIDYFVCFIVFVFLCVFGMGWWGGGLKNFIATTNMLE